MARVVKQLGKQEDGIGIEQHGRGRGLVLAVVVLVCVALPGSALALSWSPAVSVDAGNVLGGVACPSASVCVAVDSAGRAVSFDPGSPGGASSAPIDTNADHVLNAVACWTSSACAAVGNDGDETMFDPGDPGSPTPTPVSIGLDATSIACVVPVTTPEQCTAVGGGSEVTFNPAAPGSPTATAIDGSGVLSAVACPSALQCAAVDDLGQAVTFDPGPPASATTTTKIDSGVNNELGGVACPLVSQCTAVDGAGRAVTFDPGSPSSPAPTVAQRDTTPDNELEGIACPSAGVCVADDVGGNIAQGDPTGSTAFTVTPVAASTLLSGVACYSATACVAVDQSGNVYVGSSTATPAPPAAAPVFTADTPPALSPAKFYGIGVGTSGAITSPAYRFVASGSPAPTYSVSSGALPTGMMLNPSTGLLTGTPTVGGQAYSFTVTASNSVAPAAVTASITGTVGAQTACATAIPGEPNNFTSTGTTTVTSTVNGSSDATGQVDGDPVLLAPGIVVTTDYGPGTYDTGPNGDCPITLLAGQVDTNVEQSYAQTIVDQSTTPPPPLSTSTVVTAGPASSSFGQSVTYHATITPTSPNATVPSGTVAFTARTGSATTNLCTTTLSGGSGSCTSAGAPDGTDTITATYSGDGTFAGSSGTTTETVTSGPSPVSTRPPVSTGPPVVSGSARAGKVLSCTQGSWTNDPTRFAYQWSYDGTPIQAATNSTYKVQSGDEGLTLECTVTASNTGGAGTPATSAGRSVPVPHVARCPAATGKLKGITLGLLRLGMTRAQALHAYAHSSNRGKKYQDFFCLTPNGVRVGIASPKLIKTLPKSERKLAGHVIWASTSSLYYSIHGIRCGATIAAAAKQLKLTGPFHIGLNYWYLAPNGTSTAVFKVRAGIIQEIGIADKQLTTSHKQQLTFLKSFT